MSGKPDTWMPLFIGDYLADTKRLSLSEHGAYLLLIMDYWRNGAPPDDDAVLARVLGVEKRVWCKIRAKIAPLFDIQDGRWTHGRIEQELAGARERSGKAADKAKRAASMRWSRARAGKPHAEADAPGNAPSISPGMLRALPEAMHEQCPPPVTCSVPSEQRAHGLKDQAWSLAVEVFTGQGRLSEQRARSAFGKLLKETQLPAEQLLPALQRCQLERTRDPIAYMTRGAKAVADRLRERGGLQPTAEARIANWGEAEWRQALAIHAEDGRWPDEWGPLPGDPGCRVPPTVLAEQTPPAGAEVIPFRGGAA
jgi:uncharacterized protein YdaU (DUF1376 family)